MSRLPRLLACVAAASILVGTAGCADLTGPGDAPEIAANDQHSGV